MESSEKIGKKNFAAVKMFAKDLVKALNVDNSKTEIAIVTYSGSYTGRLSFNKLKGNDYS